MTFGPVGIRCPDHSGKAQGARRVVQNVQRRTNRNPDIVTKTLVGLNVGIYLLQLAQGAPITGNGGSIYEKGVLVGRNIGFHGQPIGLAEGEWWRLITATFLHYGPVHLAMNMLALWMVGRALEETIGPLRFTLIYLVSGVAGSAGALLLGPLSHLFSPDPSQPTVGASGAIFGIFGAVFVLERQGRFIMGSSVIPLLVLNLAITFSIPFISKGGHVGGLIGGALAMFALSRFGTGSAVYGRNDIVSIGGVLAVGVLSVAVAYWKVKGYA
jgi:membrane associated rhomboid family serine protease